MTTTNSPACPSCGKPLQKVTRDPDSMFNAEQFDAVRAGDWFCEACPDNGRARTGYRYFWDSDLAPKLPAVRQATTEPHPLVEDIRAAMRQAFSLGQTYWQQSDSDSAAQNRASDETSRKFSQLVADTCGALATGIAQSAAQVEAGSISDDIGFPDVLGEFVRNMKEGKPFGTGSMALTSYIDQWHARIAVAQPAAPSDAARSWKLTKLGAIGEYGFTALASTEQAEELPPLPWQCVVQAIRAVSDEAHERGRMYPQTSAEQHEDLKAVERVIGMIEFYAPSTNLNSWPRADLAARQAPASTLTQSSDRALWTDEQRANHRKNQALVYSCTICCARKGEPHLPSCSESGICGA